MALHRALANSQARAPNPSLSGDTYEQRERRHCLREKELNRKVTLAQLLIQSRHGAECDSPRVAPVIGHSTATPFSSSFPMMKRAAGP